MNTSRAFEVFMAEKKAQGLSERTLEAYSYAAKPLVEACPRLPCKPQIVQDYIYDNNWSQEKRAFVYRHVRAFMRWIAKKYQIANPMDAVLPPRVKRKQVKYLSRAEIQMVDVWLRDGRDKALIYTLLDTGIRVGELLGIRPEDIREEDMLVDGKTGMRAVPISPATKHLLLSLPAYKDGYIFHGQNKGKNSPRLTRNGVRQLTDHYLSIIGFSGKHGPHVFRHTFAVHALLLGMDIITLRTVMGHTSTQTTEQYLHLAHEDVVRQHHAHTPLQIIADPVKVDGGDDNEMVL